MMWSLSQPYEPVSMLSVVAHYAHIHFENAEEQTKGSSKMIIFNHHFASATILWDFKIDAYDKQLLYQVFI